MKNSEMRSQTPGPDLRGGMPLNTHGKYRFLPNYSYN